MLLYRLRVRESREIRSSLALHCNMLAVDFDVTGLARHDTREGARFVFNPNGDMWRAHNEAQTLDLCLRL